MLQIPLGQFHVLFPIILAGNVKLFFLICINYKIIFRKMYIGLKK